MLRRVGLPRNRQTNVAPNLTVTVARRTGHSSLGVAFQTILYDNNWMRKSSLKKKNHEIIINFCIEENDGCKKKTNKSFDVKFVCQNLLSFFWRSSIDYVCHPLHPCTSFKYFFLLAFYFSSYKTTQTRFHFPSHYTKSKNVCARIFYVVNYSCSEIRTSLQRQKMN